MLHNSPMEEQQLYLNMCLDLTLECAISSKIDPDTPIFQDDDNPYDNYCLQYLKDIFLGKYPLVTRRYECLSAMGNDYVYINSHAEEEGRGSRNCGLTN